MSMTTSTNTIAALGPIGGHSTSDSDTLLAAFPASPLNVIPQLKESESAPFASWPMTAYYMDNVLNGRRETNPLFPNGVDMDYGTGNGTEDAYKPSKSEDVPTGAAGLPANAWMPNVVSPGPGSINPADMGNPPPKYLPDNAQPTFNPVRGNSLEFPWEGSVKQAATNLGGYSLGSSAG